MYYPRNGGTNGGDEVIIIVFDDKIEILPKKRPELDKFFDIIEVEIKTKDLKKELLEDLL